MYECLDTQIRTIQGHAQQWTHKTQDEDKQKHKHKAKKISNGTPPTKNGGSVNKDIMEHEKSLKRLFLLQTFVSELISTVLQI